MAAKRARELVRQKSVLRSSSLPGKLADCSSTNPEESGKFSILLVEFAVLFQKSKQLFRFSASRSTMFCLGDACYAMHDESHVYYNEIRISLR